jgi:hypothetical protein
MLSLITTLPLATPPLSFFRCASATLRRFYAISRNHTIFHFRYAATIDMMSFRRFSPLSPFQAARRGERQKTPDAADACLIFSSFLSSSFSPFRFDFQISSLAISPYFMPLQRHY